MFNNRTSDGRNNICGVKIAKLRKNLKISQRQLADNLQMINLDIDKNAIQRIESGQRFVTDIELIALAKVFNTTIAELLKND
ncbi:MAG: helix-turn-helix domain-containing protein [Oscillospiraceae bacterium]